MMREIRGTPTEFHPLRRLRKEMDLIYFEGPLLSLFSNAQGDLYLYYWCDADDDANRWLVFRTSQDELAKYLEQRTTLRHLILNANDGWVFAVDLNRDLEPFRVVILDPLGVPSDYLPGEDSTYDFEPIHFELDLPELAKRYSSSVGNVHLLSGDGIRFGTAQITTLGPILAHYGELSENIAINLYAQKRTDTAKRVTKKEARAYGSQEFVTHIAASFSAILRPTATQMDLLHGEERVDLVMAELLQLIESGRNYDDLLQASKRFDETVFTSLDALLRVISEHKVDVQFSWVTASASSLQRARVNPNRSEVIRNNIHRLEYQDSEEIQVEGRFTALDITRRTFAFVGQDRDFKAQGRIDRRIQYPLTGISFKSLYRIQILRHSVKNVGKKAKVADTLIGIVEDPTLFRVAPATVEEMVDWFLQNYETPEQGVPYLGREYGYAFDEGGPYDPLDELQEEFPDADDGDRERAVERIYSIGGTEWVKKGQY